MISKKLGIKLMVFKSYFVAFTMFIKSQNNSHISLSRCINTKNPKMTKMANQVSEFVNPNSEHPAEYELNTYQLHLLKDPNRM